MAVSLVRRDRIMAGLASGLVASAVIAAFAAVDQRRAGAPVGDTYRFLAQTVAGTAATDAAWAVPLGVAVLLVAAVLWAFGYVSAAQRQPQLLRRPVISGIGFGVIVWFISELMLLPVGMFRPPSLFTFDRDILAFTVFFGLPLALTASRLVRSP
jgi:hypothetical protein